VYFLYILFAQSIKTILLVRVHKFFDNVLIFLIYQMFSAGTIVEDLTI
jgi:hypothetical protein